jgi:hypothetical protein
LSASFPTPKTCPSSGPISTPTDQPPGPDRHRPPSVAQRGGMSVTATVLVGPSLRKLIKLENTRSAWSGWGDSNSRPPAPKSGSGAFRSMPYRSSPISGGLAGVMAGWSKTVRIGRHGPAQTGLIHQRYIVEPTRRDIMRRLRTPMTPNSTPELERSGGGIG